MVSLLLSMGRGGLYLVCVDVVTVLDDAQRYLCTYCGCDITLRLKCAVCPDFDLCLQVGFECLTVRILAHHLTFTCPQCYAAGASIGPHKSTHPYQLIVSWRQRGTAIYSVIWWSKYLQDEGSFPLLVESWGAIEEVLLLDAVEQDGFGNW